MFIIRQCYSPLVLGLARSSTRHSLKRISPSPAFFRCYSINPPKQPDSFEKVIKAERPPLHEDGHCSLEDKPKEIPREENNTEEKQEQKAAQSSSFDDIKNLPSEAEANRSEFSKWMTERLDKLQATIFTAGQTLNDFTGYSSIEKLKNSIEKQG